MNRSGPSKIKKSTPVGVVALGRDGAGEPASLEFALKGLWRRLILPDDNDPGGMNGRDSLTGYRSHRERPGSRAPVAEDVASGAGP
jgi:hypothetical protein